MGRPGRISPTVVGFRYESPVFHISGAARKPWESLSAGMTETRGSLNGNIRLAPDFGAEPGGAWEISAESPGYAPARTRIPAK